MTTVNAANAYNPYQMYGNQASLQGSIPAAGVSAPAYQAQAPSTDTIGSVPAYNPQLAGLEQDTFTPSTATSVAVPEDLGAYRLAEEQPQKKKNILPWVIGLGVTLAGAAYVVHRGGDAGNLWEKLKAGCKNIKAEGLFKSSAKDKINDEVSEKVSQKVVDKLDDLAAQNVEMIKTNGDTVIRLPEKAQKLRGSVSEITQEASKLGIDDLAKNLADDASNITGLNLVVEEGGKKHLITWKQSADTINCKVMGKDGKAVEFDAMSDNFKKMVNDSIEAIKNKKMDSVSTGVEVRNVVYKNKLADGALGTYLYQGSSSGASTSKLKNVVTDRFSLASDEVCAAMKNDKKLAEAVEAANPKPGRWFNSKPDYSKWHVKSATHTPTVDGWPVDAKIVIENNKVVGVMENGKLASQTRFDALQYKYPKAFEDVLNKKLDAVVRYLP